jgi:hypothetical protein
MLYVFLLLLLSDDLSIDSIATLPTFALVGLLPGAVVAAVWIAINFNQLKPRTRGNQDA